MRTLASWAATSSQLLLHIMTAQASFPSALRRSPRVEPRMTMADHPSCGHWASRCMPAGAGSSPSEAAVRAATAAAADDYSSLFF